MAFFSGGSDRAKLIALYVLKEFRTPITWEQLYTALAYQDGPGFFEMGEFYNELVAGGYIVPVPAKGQQLLSLTEKGAAACDLFQNEIARSVRDSVAAFADERREEFKRRNCVVSDAHPLPSGAWALELALLDNEGSLFELNMRMPDAPYAYRAQQYWAQNAERLYMELLQKLTAKQGEAAAEDKGSSESPSAGLGLANPVKDMNDIASVNARVGCHMAVCPGAAAQSFAVIDTEPPLGQYNFILGGARYTLRACRTEEDITGVWVDGGTLTDRLKGARETGPVSIGGWCFTRFFIDDMQYALCSPDAGLEAFADTAKSLERQISD